MIPLPRRTTGLTHGPLPLDEATLQREVPAGTAGVFAAGYETRSAGELAVCLVGRADADLRAALRPHIGRFSDFKFEPVADPARAFALECDIYHAFEPTANESHPVPPPGWVGRCPTPACFALG